MTYDGFETSLETGEPIEIYEFAVGSEVFQFTSTEDDYVYNGQTYFAIPIGRSSISLSGEIRQDTLTVEMPGSETFPQLYTTIIPDTRANLTIRRLHRPDGGSPQAILVYKGTVRSVAFTDSGDTAKISVVPISNKLSRQIPRYTYQGLCNHFLFDSRCKVIKTLFQFTVAPTVDTGKTLTVPGLTAAKGDGWATGGYAQLGSSEFRQIIKQDSDVLTLNIPFKTNLVGMDIDIFAGCDHTIATCKSKFNNVINYGGSSFVPLKNLFSTGLGK